MKDVQEVREMAHKLIEGRYKKASTDIFTSLRNFPFDFSTEPDLSQRQIANFNLRLDGRSCLGRITQAGAMIEKEFPEVNLMCGEVMEDFFRNVLLGMLKENPNQPDSFFSELLMYEEPHNILLVDGKQFEPLSILYRQDISHPQISSFPFWEAVTASRLISKAWLEDSPYKKIEILAEAERICPGMLTTKENLTSCLLLLDREREAIELAKETLLVRPTARAMYFLYLLTKDKKNITMIEKNYSSRIVQLLGREVIENGG
jgi:hypothetical protein